MRSKHQTPKLSRPAMPQPIVFLLTLIVRMIPLIIVKPGTVVRWHRDGFRMGRLARSEAAQGICPRRSATGSFPWRDFGRIGEHPRLQHGPDQPIDPALVVRMDNEEGHHILILGEDHLRSVLNQYVYAYFNAARPQQGHEQRIPGSVDDKSPNGQPVGGKVVTIPILGGLHR